METTSLNEPVNHQANTHQAASWLAMTSETQVRVKVFFFNFQIYREALSVATETVRLACLITC